MVAWSWDSNLAGQQLYVKVNRDKCLVANFDVALIKGDLSSDLTHTAEGWEPFKQWQGSSRVYEGLWDYRYLMQHYLVDLDLLHTVGMIVKLWQALHTIVPANVF